jgi:hypothetical protein
LGTICDNEGDSERENLVLELVEKKKERIKFVRRMVQRWNGRTGVWNLQ